MAIPWNPETMSTGDAVIDAQHRKLIDGLNRLLDAMKEGKGKAEIEGLLEFLGGYAATHFKHEEGCMARRNCPVADANKKAHAGFIDTFSGLSERISKEGPSLSLVVEVQNKLGEWVRNHIIRIDTHLRHCDNTR